MANTANEYQLEQVIQTVKAQMDHELGEREKKVEKMEAYVSQYLDICKICISALRDTHPNLTSHLLDKMRSFS